MFVLLTIWIIGILWMIVKYPTYAERDMIDDRTHRIGYVMTSIIWPVILVLAIKNVYFKRKED